MGHVTGVKVRRGQEEVEIHAPVVVSNCGIFTTFQKLLPPEIHLKTGEQQIPGYRTNTLVRFCWEKIIFLLPFGRYSETTEHNEARQRIVLGLLWI